MKTLTIKLKVPREIQALLSDYYTTETLQLELREECQDFLYDIYHALKANQEKANEKKDERKEVA